MAKTQGVTHLMRRNKANQLPHELIINLSVFETLIQRTTLDGVPFLQKVYHIMEPTDMTLDNFTAARVDDMGAISIFRL